LYRTRCSGHAVALCGAAEGRVEARGASVERAEVAVLLDQPLGVVARGEVADGVADLIDGLEDTAVDRLLFQRAEDPLDNAVRQLRWQCVHCMQKSSPYIRT
jgi:enoyl reductase-like protein